MIELNGGEIFVEKTADRTLCQLAAEISTDSKLTLEINRITTPFPLGEAASERVLQGLARISLQAPDYDYHGLTQRHADNIIDNLCDDVEYFFYPILAQAER
ncbi:MAG TPA: hypothetical protein VFH99_01440 [Candidatus Saccharimonadales bacterium]|nr:hypothetical protein [Candidatus Saccharimonadales bacterium]